METQESETQTRQKSVLPYLIGAAVIVILAVATFLAGRYLNAGVGPLTGEEGRGSELKQAEELPQTEPDTSGVVQERNDNIIVVGPADRISIMVPKPGSGGEPVMDVDYTGDKVEVVVSNETLIYRDTTDFDPENAPAVVQQTVELSTIDDIAPQTVIMVWGRKAGDRIIADVIEFSSPFVAHKGAP